MILKNVLSLFDGISCGQIALKKAGIGYEKYYSSEVDKFAIRITQENHPDTVQIGDANLVRGGNLPQIDLLIGGSPCQDLSKSANRWTDKKTKGLHGDKSRLFWEYVRIFKETKPRCFLFENVGSMKAGDAGIITKELGVEGRRFNSNLLLPQNRNRIYWTNIPFTLPVGGMTMTMQDMLEKEVDPKYYLTRRMYDCVTTPATKGWINRSRMEIDPVIAKPLIATMHKMHRADMDNYVTGASPDGIKTNVRRLTPLECERLQGIPEGYTASVSDTQRYKLIGNGWTVDVIAHIFKFITPK
jgi:DNA-cytosine methyltransferase